MRTVLLTLAAALVVGILAAGGIVYLGLYDISATDQHLQPTYRLMDVAMRRSVARRAADIEPPPLDDEHTIQTGLGHYKEHCVQCHGAPGVAPEPFALGLTPAAANLAHTGREWTPAELYWTVKNGIKMTGMPAWQYRLSEEELWSIVAFVRVLHRLSPDEYRRMAEAGKGHRHVHEPAQGNPDTERGKVLMHQYACVTCHRIPGVVGPDAPVGPPLDGMGSRAVIAGVLKHEPGELERWLRSPQEINPKSAMPDLGVTERDARDMAAFLETLK